MVVSRDYVLAVLLPGAGHIARHRRGWRCLVGWLLVTVWSVGWQLVLLAGLVIPQTFPRGTLSAATGAIVASWVCGVAHLWWLGEAQTSVETPAPCDDRAARATSDGASPDSRAEACRHPANPAVQPHLHPTTVRSTGNETLFGEVEN